MIMKRLNIVQINHGYKTNFTYNLFVRYYKQSNLLLITSRFSCYKPCAMKNIILNNSTIID